MSHFLSHLTRFHHQIYGPEQGPQLVFLHGLMGSSANWRRIISYLEHRYRILVFDQRGHGRSFQPETGYSPQDYADDLLHLLDELNWNQVLLVGHSMGGRNALCFSVQWPHRVKKLILEDIGPESKVDSMLRIEKMIQLVPTPFPDRKAAKDFFSEKFPKLISDDPQALVLARYFYSNIELKPEGPVDWRFSQQGILLSLKEGRQYDGWSAWKELKVPTLVIRGEKSQDLSQEVFEKMLKLNSLAKGVEVAGAGHWVHFDQPEAFLAVLHEFLDGEFED